MSRFKRYSMTDTYFDSHTHLCDSLFAGDLNEVLLKAREGGVGRMMVVGGDAESNVRAIELAGGDEGGLYASVGVHPNTLGEVKDGWRDELKALAERPEVLAIGETGLDLFRDKVPLDRQLEAMWFHLELSSATGLPVIIHQRSAEEVMVDLLRDFIREHGQLSGVMHCFTGDEEYAEILAELNMYVSFAGPITYARNRGQRHALAVVPEDRLLIETDSPYLPPEGHRGERCEPWMIRSVAERVAEQLQLDVPDVARITRRNALKLFGIEWPDTGAITYRIRRSLYVNVTNECSNSCTFCPRAQGHYVVKGHNLLLDHAPSAEEIMAGIEAESERRPKYKEIVFCGFGEPTLRLDVMLQVGRALKAKGIKTRLNTNGQGSLINGRDIVKDIAGAIDEVSISLNATDADAYGRLCRPDEGTKAWQAMMDFAGRCVEEGIDTVMTVVGVQGLDIARAQSIAESKGARFKVRRENRVG